MSFFTKEIIAKLNEPLAKEAVSQREGTGKNKLSYLASHYVIEQANQLFGHGMWGTEIQHLHQVDKTQYEKPPYKAGDAPKQMVSISYLCQLKLTVNNGTSVVSHEDSGFGNGVAGDSACGSASCIELASKEAVTDALKRCLRYYGNQFGLSLYNKDEVPLSQSEIENTKLVTEEQLSKLRDLYEARDIGDDWVLAALKAENYSGTLEDMRYDWYMLAVDLVTKYKLDEIQSATYDADMANVIKLLSESANFNMAKALFKEAWEKASAQQDKETQLKAQKIYEELKTKFGVK